MNFWWDFLWEKANGEINLARTDDMDENDGGVWRRMKKQNMSVLINRL